MASHGILLASLLVLSCLSQTSYGIVLFSSLKDSLFVTASHTENQVLKAGIDKLTVSWGLNQSSEAGTDSTFKTIKVKLCYAPVSQVDRGWRKTVDNLAKDKTCMFKIVERSYTSKSNDSVEWTIERDVPGATYFVRAYAFNAAGQEVAYGQTTNAKKTANLFVVEGISGRHVSLDIASVVFSVFSVLSLAGFFIALHPRDENEVLCSIYVSHNTARIKVIATVQLVFGEQTKFLQNKNAKQQHM